MHRNQVSEVLFERLKCESCGTHVRAGKYRWYLCLSYPSQHKTCQDCKEVKNRKFCPCGGFITKEHCTMTEELLKAGTMRFKCTNLSRGCQEIHGEESMISHEIECIYRLVLCPDLGCDKQVPFHELLEHLKGVKVDGNDHFWEEHVMQKGLKVLHSHWLSEAMLEGNFNQAPVKIEFDGRVFLFLGEQFVYEDTFYCWIQIVGSKYEAKNYIYTLEFHGNDPNVRSTYSGQVISIDETADSIKDNCLNFGINFKILKKQFVGEDSAYKVSIGIRNMKEELKDDNEESGISDNDD